MTIEDIEASKAPLMDHLIELRSRLIKALLAFGIAFIFCFFFAKQIFNVLVWPYVLAVGDPGNAKLIYTAFLEYFLTQLKLAMFGAAFISFPIVAGQIYMFVAPGLYKHERNAFLLRAGRGAGLFCGVPDAGEILARHAATRRRRDRKDRAVAEGRRISVADDVADLRLRHRVPASGHPDAFGADRHRHREDAAREAALFHRHRLRDRSCADAARRDQPGLARDPAAGALRGRDRGGRHRGEEGRSGQVLDHASARQPAARSQSGGIGALTAAPANKPSFPAKAGNPVRRGRIYHELLWNTGSPAFAGDDGCGNWGA